MTTSDDRNLPGEDSGAGEYDLAPNPVRYVAVAPVEVPPLAATRLDYRSANSHKPQRTDTGQITNLYMPLWLLVGGVIVQGCVALFRERNYTAAFLQVMIEVGLGTALMLVAVLIAARVRGIQLGFFRFVLLKLAAISVAPGAAVALVTPILNLIPFGGLLGLAVGFILYFALLGALFDLDESDTWYCVCVIFLVHLAEYFLAPLALSV